MLSSAHDFVDTVTTIVLMIFVKDISPVKLFIFIAEVDLVLFVKVLGG